LNNNARHIRETLDSQSKELTRQIENTPFFIFLCGPSLDKTCSSAHLRKRIKESLEKEQFTVVLGEDEGLEELRKEFGKDAQTNELNFISGPNCRAVILIADSVGSHCELGLFNWLFASESSEYFDKNKINFYVIADEKFKDDRSYFNEGPIKTLKDAKGSVEYCDFSSFDLSQIICELKGIRAREIKLSSNGNR